MAKLRVNGETEDISGSGVKLDVLNTGETIEKVIKSIEPESITPENKGIEDNNINPEGEENLGPDETLNIDTDKVIEEATIPKHIDRILNVFCNLDQMYISKHGGVFNVDSDKSLIEGCTLYKNKYFNK